ncbi:hypothetical protein H1R20_g827, partial [Candolleomyces eurysporus]
MPRYKRQYRMIDTARDGSVRALMCLQEFDWKSADEPLTQSALKLVLARLELMATNDPTYVVSALEMTHCIALAGKVLSSTPSEHWADLLFLSAAPLLHALVQAMDSLEPSRLLIGFRNPLMFASCLASNVLRSMFTIGKKEPMVSRNIAPVTQLVFKLWFWGRVKMNPTPYLTSVSWGIIGTAAIEAMANTLINDDIRREIILECQRNGKQFCKAFAMWTCARTENLIRVLTTARHLIPNVFRLVYIVNTEWSSLCSVGTLIAKSSFFSSLFASMERSSIWNGLKNAKPSLADAFAESLALHSRHDATQHICQLISMGLFLPTMREIVLTTSIYSTHPIVYRCWDLFHTLCNITMDRQAIPIIAYGVANLKPWTGTEPTDKSTAMWEAFIDSVKILGEGYELATINYPNGVCDNLQAFLNNPKVQEKESISMAILEKLGPQKIGCNAIFPVLVVEPVPTKCIYYSVTHFREDLEASSAPRFILGIVDYVLSTPETQLGLLTFQPPDGLRRFVIGAYAYCLEGEGKVYELLAGADMLAIDIPIDFDTTSPEAQWKAYLPSPRHGSLFEASLPNEGCSPM